MTRLLLAAALLLPGGPASAQHSFSATQAFGSADNEKIANFRGDLQFDELSLTPQLTLASRGFLHETIKDLSVRLGYRLPRVGLGLTAGIVPEFEITAGGPRRKAWYVGADVSTSLSSSGLAAGGPEDAGSRSGAKARGPARLAAGGGIRLTRHSQASAGPASRLDQMDLHAFAGATLPWVDLTGRLTQSFYSEDIGPASTAALPFPGIYAPIEGIAPLGNHFPGTTFQATGMLLAVPFATPFASYVLSKTKERPAAFKAPDAVSAFTLGAALGLRRFEVVGYYQRYLLDGHSDQNYSGLGATLRF